MYRQRMRFGIIMVGLEALVLHIHILKSCNIIECPMNNSF